MIKILLLISCCFITLSAIAQDTFSGRWNIIYNDSDNEMRDYFALTLTQDSTSITGFHLATIDYGSFLDYWGDGSIDGKIINGVAMITIKSGRSATKTGTAKMEHIGKDSLQFTLIKEPSGGEHMIPKDAILTKDKSYKQNRLTTD